MNWLRTAANTDVSLPILGELMEQGYTTVTWNSNIGAEDAPCTSLDGQEWDIADFISGLDHSSPIYEKSHPNCACRIVITGPDLETITLDALGNVY